MQFMGLRNRKNLIEEQFYIDKTIVKNFTKVLLIEWNRSS